MRYVFPLPIGGETPVSGLSPTVTGWRRIDGSLPETPVPDVYELNAGSAAGWYYFDVDTDEHLVCTVDGGAGAGSIFRYYKTEIKPQTLPNEVIEYTDWDVRGNPTAGTIKGYQGDDGAGSEAYEGTLEATYDAAGRITSVTRRR